MTDRKRTPGRFGVHASVIQLLALFVTGAILDGGMTQLAGTLASLLFWLCAALLLAWHVVVSGGSTCSSCVGACWCLWRSGHLCSVPWYRGGHGSP